ncbi:hypothetical protein WB388_32480 [Streptomyces brasiliscabiei]|uniref:Transposase n=1 Tax=Streptomyces brasiliscabiei TaxID=2736302 RepID=A0ABU8GE37_9ACTN
MRDLPSRRDGLEWCISKVALANSAHLELVSGVVQLRPEDAIDAAGPRAQQKSRGLQDETVDDRRK